MGEVVEQKRRHINLTLLIVIVAIVITLVMSFFYIRNADDEDPIKKVVNDVVSIFTGDDDNKPAESPTSTSSSGGLISGDGSGIGGGSGGGSGGSGSGSGSNCYQEYLAYSLDFSKNTTCNNLQLGICLDKTIRCSAEIQNLDVGASGTFKVRLDYIEQGKNINDTLSTVTQDFTLSAREIELFSDTKSFQSTGENGTANQEINCIFQTLEVPQKTVCS